QGSSDVFFNNNAGDRTFAVDLPVSSPAGSIGLTVARLADGTILDLELSALETENKGEVIASPRVITANQKEAYIEAGEEIPYLEQSSAGNTSITFKKAVLSLTVTPQITPDDRIILDLVVKQDTRGEDTPSGPAINTREVGTQVLVENGETVVLGGVYQQRTNRDVTKVPFLGDLPGVGVLFRSTKDSSAKQELLMFVTPKIVKESVR
ncbi:MAG: type IV pilus secretin PilQ, partial [Kangiellaceae bacterium]|nr:type IV pilus secretin PilQ [Kangiellaceae bacterium]